MADRIAFYVFNTPVLPGSKMSKGIMQLSVSDFISVAAAVTMFWH